ncbi:MAG: divalent cation tolerance protein CutA, partial [Alphaproteobacteria bacterium]
MASVEQAQSIGRVLVEERLAACVNVLAPMRSIYRWDGRIIEDT